MEFKNVKDLSNAEIKLYQESLKNMFDVLKNEIKEKCDDLEKIDVEYSKTEQELKIRQGNIY